MFKIEKISNHIINKLTNNIPTFLVENGWCTIWPWSFHRIHYFKNFLISDFLGKNSLSASIMSLDKEIACKRIYLSIFFKSLLELHCNNLWDPLRIFKPVTLRTLNFPNRIFSFPDSGHSLKVCLVSISKLEPWLSRTLCLMNFLFNIVPIESSIAPFVANQKHQENKS